MMQANDNPQQGNRGGQEYGDDNFDKSQRNQDSQRHATPPDENKAKQTNAEEGKEDDEKEKFSPGEPDDYNAEEFSTD